MEKRTVRGLACLLTTVLFFSTFEAVSKGILGRINPYQITFVRFLAGGILLLGACALRGELRWPRRDLPALLLAAAVGITLSMNLLQLSLSLPGAKASVCAVAFSANPLFVFLLDSARKKQKPGGLKIVGLILCVAGLGAVFATDLARGLGSPAALVLALLSSATYALYTLMGRDLAARGGSLRFNAWSFTAGALMTAPFLLAAGIPLIPRDPSVAPQLAYLSVLVTGAAYLAYFEGLRIVGAAKGSLVFFLKPALATLFAWLLLGERPGPGLLAGIALIAAGIALISRPAGACSATPRAARP